MNVKYVSVSLLAVVLIVSLSAVSISAETTYSEKTVNLESGSDIGTTIQETSEDTNLIIILESNGNYTFTSDGNRNYDGHNLIIVGNNATVMLPESGTTKVELNYEAAVAPGTSYDNLIGSVCKITDVNFTTDSSTTSCYFSLGYFQDVLISGCTFEKISVSLQSYSPGFEGLTESTYEVSDCIWTSPSGSYAGQFALTMQCVHSSISDCSIDGYDRGVNASCSQYDGRNSVSIQGMEFSNIDNGPGIQVSYSLLNADISGCNFMNCEVGIQIHETTVSTGSVNSSDNSFIGCDSDFCYSSNDETGDISNASLRSTGDLFTTANGQQKEPVISSGENATDYPTDVVIEDPVQVDPEPPIIWDDEDDYVPIPPVVVDDSSDDDTVTVVACAAAAVVAALMAVFLIIERRKG